MDANTRRSTKLSIVCTGCALAKLIALAIEDEKSEEVRYAYDPLYELIGDSRGDASDGHERSDSDKGIKYTYDEVGNRLTQTRGNQTIHYSYDADDRLLFADTGSFTYDANGNQTSSARTHSSQPIIYQYDAANKLISVTGWRRSSSFSYDGDGNRIRQSVGDQTFKYLNDVATPLPAVLQEQDSDYDPGLMFVYGHGRISESVGSVNLFYQYDVGCVSPGKENLVGTRVTGEQITPPPG